MNFTFKFSCFSCLFFLFINPTHCQQLYDESNCSSSESNYLCSLPNFSCDTYIVYRAQKNFHSLSNISSLFDLTLNRLLGVNNLTEAESRNLSLGREIVIPINCSCTGQSSQAIVMYSFSSSDSFASVACGNFEGLVKAQSLADENPGFGGGSAPIKVPIRCACPTENDRSNGVKHLVTYPVKQNDHTNLIASKFGVPEEMIWEANRLQSFETIFPKTTLLIPITSDDLVVKWDVGNGTDDSAPSPGGTIPSVNVISSTETEFLNPKLLLALGAVVVFLFYILACCVCVYITRKNHPRSFQPLSPKTSGSSDLSPDFLEGVSKLKQSLINFSMEELICSTQDFSCNSLIGTEMYRGKMGSSYVAIEQMSSEEEARRVISILTKINHVNVVRLEGCCYASTPYLVFEYAEYGCLRDCLSNSKISRQLTWEKRLQIAFDLAVAINYIHCCTKPAYVHRNIKSRNVLINSDWRAKLSGFRLAKPVTFNEMKRKINWNEPVVTGNYTESVADGLGSLKVDVFAYGAVLLELLSAKGVAMDGKLLKHPVSFIMVEAGFGNSSKSLEKLKKFMDPALEGEYPLADAMCLAVLARACIDENPLHRPTMGDVLKALSTLFFM